MQVFFLERAPLDLNNGSSWNMKHEIIIIVFVIGHSSLHFCPAWWTRVNLDPVCFWSVKEGGRSSCQPCQIKTQPIVPTKEAPSRSDGPSGRRAGGQEGRGAGGQEGRKAGRLTFTVETTPSFTVFYEEDVKQWDKNWTLSLWTFSPNKHGAGVLLHERTLVVE